MTDYNKIETWINMHAAAATENESLKDRIALCELVFADLLFLSKDDMAAVYVEGMTDRAMFIEVVNAALRKRGLEDIIEVGK